MIWFITELVSNQLGLIEILKCSGKFCFGYLDIIYSEIIG